MKRGRKKSQGGSRSDAVHQLPLPPLVTDSGGSVDASAAHTGRYEAPAPGTVVNGQDEQKQDEQGQEEGEEREKGYEKFDQLQIDGEVEADAEAERPKLAEGYYEIEAVRRKRVRKGQVQYLIKWRGWPETANTWEPLENLLSCSDVIEAFEESLRSGKHRISRKRKRKFSTTHTQSKKKQQTSPAAATYNVPAVKFRIIEEPVLMTPHDNSALASEGERYMGGVDYHEMTMKAKNNGFGMVSKQIEEQNELNLKLRELKGTMVANEENMDKFGVTHKEAHALQGEEPANKLKVGGVEQGQPGRCIGSKRRKSGSVKRFKQDPASCVPNDAQNAMTRTANGPCGRSGWEGNQHPDLVGNELGHGDKFDIAKNMPTISKIIKPISYASSTINNVHEASITFMAMRSDGKEVMVDNKYLKANNPLLLVNFYEQHLRYSGT